MSPPRDAFPGRGADSFIKALDAYGPGGAAPPGVDREFVYVYNAANPPSSGIEVYSWWTLTVVATAPRPDPPNLGVVRLGGDAQNLIFVYRDTTDNLDRYYELDPLDNMAIISGPSLAPNGEEVNGFTGGTGRTYISTSAPNYAWYLNGAEIAGAPVFFEGRTGYEAISNTFASTETNGTVNLRNPDTLADTGDTMPDGGAGRTIVRKEPNQFANWGWYLTSTSMTLRDQSLGFNYFAHTGLPFNPNLACFNMMNPPLDVISRLEGQTFPGGPDCLGGPDHPSVPNMIRFILETAGGVPFGWDESLNTVRTQIERFDGLFGPLTIPAYPATAGCWVELEEGGSYVQITTFDDGSFRIRARLELYTTVNLASAGQQLKLRTDYLL